MQQEFTYSLPKSQWLCRNFSERFWSRVTITETCWVWRSHKGRYSKIYRGLTEKDSKLFPPSHIAVHRASWIMHFGAIPEGKCVCHKCDNPKCVRPDHLFLGSHDENMKDMAKKRRSSYGEYSPKHKHTFEVVTQIRNLHASGIKQIDLARIYGIDRGNICRIVHHKIWPHEPHRDFQAAG